MSKSREMDTLADSASPEKLARVAAELDCLSIAFTYNDPVIFHEYAIDVAAACREQGVKETVAVTAAYIDPEPRVEFFAAMDAANVDLKGFYRPLLSQDLRRASGADSGNHRVYPPPDRLLAGADHVADSR